MRPPFHPSIVRIGVRPDEPAVVAGPRPRGSRRPHADAKVAEVRRLIEQTTQTYSEIAAKTGVGCASICRWTRDGGWQRPLFAPRATDTVPRERASARLKARTLAARLQALAERYIRELEDTPGVDLDKLGEALELMKMAKLAARPKRRRAPGAAAADAGLATWEVGARTAMRTMRAAGVATERAPEEALEDFISSRAPPREDLPRPRRRGNRLRSDSYHAWMLERE
jgi:hypothetical protein